MFARTCAARGRFGLASSPALAVAALLFTAGPALGQSATAAGALSAPYPTLHNISLQWEIGGDDDLDGVVSVRFRPTGGGAWRDAMPLFRVPAGSAEGFSWSNKHAGSILDLSPDTEHEIELTLDDPDGGSETRTLTVRTRPEPRAAADPNVVQVDSSSFAAALSSAQPGDLLLMAPGTYAGFTVTSDGDPDAPIVIRAEVPGQVVVQSEVRLDSRRHVFVEGLIVNAQIKFNNAEGIVVRGCTVNTDRDGIVSMSNGVANAYIADNVVLGSTGWSNASVGANGDNLGEGIVLTGPGNVICHNYVKGFRDAISTMEDSGAHEQVSIDIYNNDIEVGADDAIEADFTMGNSRVMRNRITNSFVGLSSQPGLGGPAYFIRNTMYNIIYAPFKLHRGSVGDVALHNTSIKCGDAFAVYASDVWSRAWFRNNLFIGGEGGADYGGYSNGSGRVAQLAAADATCHFDYDGYGSIGTGTFSGRIGGTSFDSLASMRASTTEAHAQQVDMGVFEQAVGFPAEGPFPERPIADLRPAAGTAAIDNGVVIANVNDGYSGAAPDLGAYELGDSLPVYGPRPGRHHDYPLGGDGGVVTDAGQVRPDAARPDAAVDDAGAPDVQSGVDSAVADASAADDAAPAGDSGAGRTDALAADVAPADRAPADVAASDRSQADLGAVTAADGGDGTEARVGSGCADCAASQGGHAAALAALLLLLRAIGRRRARRGQPPRRARVAETPPGPGAARR